MYIHNNMNVLNTTELYSLKNGKFGESPGDPVVQTLDFHCWDVAKI